MEICRSRFGACPVTLPVSVLAALYVNALHAISIILFPKGSVRLEVIRIGGPLQLSASSCKIGLHLILGAILQHVNLARITTALPMVWTHPEWSSPCPLTIDHLNVEIELLKVMHAEDALIHL